MTNPQEQEGKEEPCARCGHKAGMHLGEVKETGIKWLCCLQWPCECNQFKSATKRKRARR